MAITEKIQKDIQKLPLRLQSEVLDYIEYLLAKADQETACEEKTWADVSLSSAMCGMEDENSPAYTVSDLKVTFERNNLDKLFYFGSHKPT